MTYLNITFISPTRSYERGIPIPSVVDRIKLSDESSGLKMLAVASQATSIPSSSTYLVYLMVAPVKVRKVGIRIRNSRIYDAT